MPELGNIFEKHRLCLSALGAIIWYSLEYLLNYNFRFLKNCLIDVELITMKLFYEYIVSTSKKVQIFSLIKIILFKGSFIKIYDFGWKLFIEFTCFAKIHDFWNVFKQSFK